jgi:peptide-methionine (R)-S-oxide reductase
LTTRERRAPPLTPARLQQTGEGVEYMKDIADRGQGPAARRSASGYDIAPLGAAEKAELAKALTREEREVILHHGTERAFCGLLLHNKEDGIYACRLCGLPLFRSGAKFESGTGWPSFTEPFDRDHVEVVEDRSYGMVRSEIRCRRCAAHLGHVFDDGPPPAGLRFCMNSLSLEFFAPGEKLPRRVAADRQEDG